MRFGFVLVLLTLLQACTLLFDAPIQSVESDGGNVECDEFGANEFVNINLANIDVDDPSVSASGLELYFNRANDIWLATREQACGPWQNPAALGIDGGLTNIGNLNLEPSGEVLHFMNGATPYTVTRDPLSRAWSTVPVLNQGLLDSIQNFYEEQGRQTNGISDVFRPSAATEILLVSTRGPEGRDTLRVDGRAIAELGLVETGAQELWATADESTVFAGTGGNIVRSTWLSPGMYAPGEDVQERAGDPWVYSSDARDLLYFSHTIGPNVRHLGVIQLE